MDSVKMSNHDPSNLNNQNHFLSSGGNMQSEITGLQTIGGPGISPIDGTASDLVNGSIVNNGAPGILNNTHMQQFQSTQQLPASNNGNSTVNMSSNLIQNQSSPIHQNQGGILLDNSSNGQDTFVMTQNQQSQIANMQGINPPFLSNMSNLSQGLGAPLLQPHSLMKQQVQQPAPQNAHLPQHNRMGQMSMPNTNNLLGSMSSQNQNQSSQGMGGGGGGGGGGGFGVNQQQSAKNGNSGNNGLPGQPNLSNSSNMSLPLGSGVHNLSAAVSSGGNGGSSGVQTNVMGQQMQQQSSSVPGQQQQQQQQQQIRGMPYSHGLNMPVPGMSSAQTSSMNNNNNMNGIINTGGGGQQTMSNMSMSNQVGQQNMNNMGMSNQAGQQNLNNMGMSNQAGQQTMSNMSGGQQTMSNMSMSNQVGQQNMNNMGMSNQVGQQTMGNMGMSNQVGQQNMNNMGMSNQVGQQTMGNMGMSNQVGQQNMNNIGMSNSPLIGSLGMQNNQNLNIGSIGQQGVGGNGGGGGGGGMTMANGHTMGFPSANNASQQQQQHQLMLQRALNQTQVQVQVQPKQSMGMGGIGTTLPMNNTGVGLGVGIAGMGMGNTSNMNTNMGLGNGVGGGGVNNSLQQSSGQICGGGVDSQFPRHMLLSQPGSLSSTTSSSVTGNQQSVMMNRGGGQQQQQQQTSSGAMTTSVTQGQNIPNSLNNSNLLIQQQQQQQLPNQQQMGGGMTMQQMQQLQVGQGNSQSLLSRPMTMPGGGNGNNNINNNNNNMPLIGVNNPGQTGSSSFGGMKQIKRPWHSLEHHLEQRTAMVQRIVSLLQQRRPHATADWHQKLPQMAKRLEDALYNNANSFEEYNDTNTLKGRLQHLAQSMGGKTPNANKKGPLSPTSSAALAAQGQGQGQSPQLMNQLQQQQQLSMQQQQQLHGQQLGQHQQQQQLQQPSSQQFSSQLSLGMQQSQQQQMSLQQVPQQQQQQQQQGMSQQSQSQQAMQGQGQGQGQFQQSHGMSQQQMPQMQQQLNNNGQQQQQQQQQMQQQHNPFLQMSAGDSIMLSSPQLQLQPSMQLQQQNVGMGMSSGGGGGGGNPTQSTYNINNNGSIQIDGQTLLQTPTAAMSGGRNNATDNNSLGSGLQSNSQTNSTSQQQPRQFINMSQINPLMAANPPVSDSPFDMSSTSVQPADGGSGSTDGKRTQTQHTEEHRRQVLKQQQQRLLLLRHASKCPHDNGRCPVTPHCAGMKQLWKHIMSCKDQECKIAHCVSSRYVLSHYSKCKEQNCPVCGPVREAIRRNYDRSRQILSMSKPQASNGSTQPNDGAVNAAPSAQAAPGPTTEQKPLAPTKAEHSTHETGRKRDRDREREREKDRAAAAAAEASHGALTTNASSSSTAAANATATTTAVSRTKQATQLDPISCALYSFTTEMIQEHMKHVVDGQMTSTRVRTECLPLVDEFLAKPGGYIFATPVDPVALHIPDYFEIIKNPMDLGTIKKRLEASSYRSVEDFGHDVQLVFDNAMLYNPKNLDVHQIAKSLRKEFDQILKQKLQSIEKETEENKKKSLDHCLLCGEQNLKYEPPVYYCNGRCNGQKIRRSSYFFSNPQNTYHWCNPCFNDIKDNQPIQLADIVLYKKDLIKKKHTEDSEEPWVQCDSCHRWVHQICTLFNGRRNFNDQVGFICPVCILARRAKKGDTALRDMKRRMQAADLPHCKLSEFLEKRVYERLEVAYAEKLEKMGGVGVLEKCSPVFIRQVSSVDKSQLVREGVYNRYKHKNYPAEFPCRTKCIVLFQNVDGQDVILFGMYVYEYGHKCPQPNQRRVYISYLDSVHYFRPRQYRTMVYHEILVAYLEYVKSRGFHTAHIWACPPLKGDDYILYCHPQDQKTPKDDRLRHWYADILKISQSRGIVEKISDLYTDFLMNESNDATVLPYFEGDYWVNEAEVIIKNLSAKGVVMGAGGAGGTAVEEEDDEMEIVPGTNKRKSTSKSKRTRASRGTIVSKQERDPVMAKLAGIIEPMKEAFFVAKLLPDEFANRCMLAQQREHEVAMAANDPEAERKRARLLQEEALVSPTGSIQTDVPGSFVKKPREALEKVEHDAEAEVETETVKEDEEEERDAFDDMATQVAAGTIETAVSPDMSDKLSMSLHGSEQGQGQGSGTSEIAVKEEESSPMATEPMETDAGSVQDGTSAVSTTTIKTTTTGKMIKTEPRGVSGKQFIKSETTPVPDTTITSATATVTVDTKPVGTEASQVLPIVPPEDSKMITKTQSQSQYQGGKGSEVMVDETEDPDDTQECEFFDTRQSFLNLCQGNHYQFDQIRRAKYTSMMVLYHLHNPDAPKFVPVCGLCTKEILTGQRHHCEPCTLDICDDCYKNQGGVKVHIHPLVAISANTGGQQAPQLTEEQRAERNRSIRLHLELLQHASTCDVAECGRNCKKMKEFLKHEATCTTTFKRGCPTCKRIYNLLTHHARNCRAVDCKVLKCKELREHFRQMTMQQQQMDDRRRTMMNETYSSRTGGTKSDNTGGGGDS